MAEVIAFPTDIRSSRSQPRRPRRRVPLWRDIVGEVLREERLDQERILTEVAATAGVSPQYLSEVERGRKEASSEVLGSVADALGLGLVDIAGRVTSRLERISRADRSEAVRPSSRFARSGSGRSGSDGSGAEHSAAERAEGETKRSQQPTSAPGTYLLAA